MTSTTSACPGLLWAVGLLFSLPAQSTQPTRVEMPKSC